jgi:hypothetical protein
MKKELYENLCEEFGGLKKVFDELETVYGIEPEEIEFEGVKKLDKINLGLACEEETNEGTTFEEKRGQYIWGIRKETPNKKEIAIQLDLGKDARHQGNREYYKDGQTIYGFIKKNQETNFSDWWNFVTINFDWSDPINNERYTNMTIYKVPIDYLGIMRTYRKETLKEFRREDLKSVAGIINENIVKKIRQMLKENELSMSYPHIVEWEGEKYWFNIPPLRLVNDPCEGTKKIVRGWLDKHGRIIGLDGGVYEPDPRGFDDLESIELNTFLDGGIEV